MAEPWREIVLRVPVKRVLVDSWAMTAEDVGAELLHVFGCWRSGGPCQSCPTWAREEWLAAASKGFRGMRRVPMSARYYGPEWPSIRLAVISRDGACQECGSNGPLDVHHRVPFREFRTRAEAHAMDNLVALCKPCHIAADVEYRRTGAVFVASMTETPRQ